MTVLPETGLKGVEGGLYLKFRYSVLGLLPNFLLRYDWPARLLESLLWR